MQTILSSLASSLQAQVGRASPVRPFPFPLMLYLRAVPPVLMLPVQSGALVLIPTSVLQLFPPLPPLPLPPPPHRPRTPPHTPPLIPLACPTPLTLASFPLYLITLTPLSQESWAPPHHHHFSILWLTLNLNLLSLLSPSNLSPPQVPFPIFRECD